MASTDSRLSVMVRLASALRKIHQPAIGVLAVALVADAPVVASQERPDSAVPLLVGVEDLRIGSVAGPEEYSFGAIGGIALDDAGRIYVADPLGHVIRVFDAGGRYLFAIGRRGSGPGELEDACCLAFGRQLLWVRDNRNARYSAFQVSADSAEFAVSVPMRHSVPTSAPVTTFDKMGHVVDVTAGIDSTTTEPYSELLHLEDDGSLARRVRVPVAPGPHVPVTGVGPFIFQQPYGPRQLLATGPRGEFAVANSGRYDVWWYDENGSLLARLQRSDVIAPPLTRGQKASAKRFLDGVQRRMGTRPPFGVPEHHPPLVSLQFDDAGRLWVQRAVTHGQPRHADVYGRDGAMVAQVEWPWLVTLAYGVLRQDVVIGSALGDLDAPQVVRLRFEPRRP